MPTVVRPPLPPATRPSARGRLHGDSFSYACPGLNSHACRHSVTLVQSLDASLLTVEAGPVKVQGRLVMIGPLVERTLRGDQVPLLLVDVEPTHPNFRALLGAVVVQRARVLDHLAFDDLRRTGLAFLSGALGGRALDSAVRSAVGELAAKFEAPSSMDARVRWMMDQIQEDPSRSLCSLAEGLGLSVEHASRLFSSQLGLSLRVYTLSAKIRLAARYMGRGVSLTEVAQMAGFVDSAHFTKVWVKCYGAPPSTFFPASRTFMDDTALPGWIRPPKC